MVLKLIYGIKPYFSKTLLMREEMFLVEYTINKIKYINVIDNKNDSDWEPLVKTSIMPSN